MSKSLGEYIREGIQQGWDDFLNGRRSRPVRAKPEVKGVWARFRSRFEWPLDRAWRRVDNVLRREIEALRNEIEELQRQAISMQDIKNIYDTEPVPPGHIRWRDEDGNEGVTPDIIWVHREQIALFAGMHVAIHPTYGVVASDYNLDDLLTVARLRPNYKELRIHYVEPVDDDV